MTFEEEDFEVKGILIDPFAREVREVEVAPGIEGIYALLQARPFDIYGLNDAGDGLYVDDEGLLRGDDQKAFALASGEIFAGRALVLGSDDEGNSIAPQRATVDSIGAGIVWDVPVPDPSGFHIVSW